MQIRMLIIFLFVALGTILDGCHGHGYLAKPLNRASLWRDPRYSQFNPNPNWNDRELNCGSYFVQYELNGGRCGPCGDDFRNPVPRFHENTGYFGQGIIAENYQRGQIIDVNLFIEAAHLGYSEFRLCSLATSATIETENCFGAPLKIAGTTLTQFPITRVGDHSLKLQLPAELNCSRCVLQWKYITGNWWGQCNNGTEAMGCGPQELFVNCADIVIRA